MNYPSSLALAFCTLGALATAQLPKGHYLAGTQGWVGGKPSTALNTVQTISPFTGKATILMVTGIPIGEVPAKFIIENPVSFLVGTKVAAAPAAGHVYRVQQQANKTWKALRLNNKVLGINVSDMTISGAYLYVCGSAIFSNTGDDAQILRIALANGATTTHLQIGNKFKVVKPMGALGLGCLIVVGPVGSLSNEVAFNGIPLPSAKLTAYTQWALLAPKVNSLSLIFSDARKLVIK